MKPPARASLLISICLLFVATFSGYAQQLSADKTESLRLKIAELESTDLKSKSAIVQDLYKRTLARLYEEYATALREDISDLKRIQETIKNTAADPQDEVAARLKKLTAELSITDEKLKTLTSDGVVPRSTSASSSPAPSEPQPPAISPADLLPSSKSSSAINPPVAPSASLSVTSVPVSATPSADPDETPATFKVCGQLRPASLTNTFAFIASAKNLEDIQTLAAADDVTKSHLKDNCDDDSTVTLGRQKQRVVELLGKLVEKLEGKHETFGIEAPSVETVKKQILTLNEYIGNAIVKFESADGKKLLTELTDKDGNFTAPAVPEGTWFISTEADDGRTRRQVHVAHNVRVNIPMEDRPVSLLARAVVGYEQAGASSTKRSQDYFFDLFVSRTLPFRQKIHPDFGERLRAWSDFRFSSVPQSGDVTIGDFSTGFATQVSGLKVKDVANVFDFMAGVEVRLTGNSALLPSFDRRTKQKFSLSFIAGGGVITPTNSLDSLTVFKVFPGAVGLPPEAVGKDFVAFVQVDRDRFFRQYYAGVRLQTFFFNLFNMPMQRFPAQFDLTVGQNEFVTGGKLKGPVFRIEGYYPLPFEEMKFINIFGSAVLRFGHATTGTPLVLQPAPDGTVVPAANVALIGLPQPNRDYYRVGFGLDFISFVQKMRDALSKK